jgi:AcrR family transcriptional regulator
LRELRAEVGTRSAQWRALRDALLELGFHRDYDALGLEDLLARAGVSAADFGREFSDLEDCYRAIYAVERDRILAEIAAASAPYVAWVDRVRATAYALWRAISADPRITHFIFVGGRGAGERARLEVEVAMNTLFDLLDEGRREPGSRATSRATAESIGGAIWNQIAAAANNEEPMAERVVRYMMYATVLPYLGTEAAEAELEMPAPPLPDPLPR